MSDVTKLKFENGTYNIKDTVARDEINNVDQKIDTNINQLENEISELDSKVDLITDNYFVNVKNYGATGDGDTDDTLAIQSALDDSSYVYFPMGNYKVSSSLLLNSQHYLKGVGRGSRLFLTSYNMPLIIADRYYNELTSANFITIEDLFLEGLQVLDTNNNTTTDRGQTGIMLHGFECSFNRVHVARFKVGLMVSGTTLAFNKMWIQTNTTGVQFANKSGLMTTVVSFEHCNIHQNERGMSNAEAEFSNSVVDLLLFNTVFEKNRQHFWLDLFVATIQNCWFEICQVKSVLRKWKFVAFSNKFETALDQWDYKVGTGQKDYRGATIIGDNGDVSINELKFQRYGTTGNDLGSLSLKEYQSSANNTIPQLGLYRDGTRFGNLKITSGNRYNRESRYIINRNGSILHNDGFSDLGLTVEKLDTGVYLFRVTSSQVLFIQATANSPTGGGATGARSTFGCYIGGGHSNQTNYNDFYNSTYFVIKTVRKGEDLVETWADAVINLTIVHE